MDRRIQRTRNSLFSAFIELRATKPVEKITVKELTEKANISKQTFYLHFQDIYDLSEYLENDALLSLIGDIPNPEYMLTNPAEASRQLCNAFINQGHLFSILFPDDNRSYGVLPQIHLLIRILVHVDSCHIRIRVLGITLVSYVHLFPDLFF